MRYRSMIAGVVMGFLAGACAKKAPAPVEEPAPPATETTQREAPREEAPAAKESPRETTDVASLAAKIQEDLRRVHFPYNSDQLDEESRNILAANSRILAEHPSIRVTVEGHCDERGTTEYNLALGERRAQAVKNFLVRAGVAESQLRTVSFGEEEPLDNGSNEEAWAQNRRAEFTVSELDERAEALPRADEP